MNQSCFDHLDSRLTYKALFPVKLEGLVLKKGRCSAHQGKAQQRKHVVHLFETFCLPQRLSSISLCKAALILTFLHSGPNTAKSDWCYKYVKVTFRQRLQPRYGKVSCAPKPKRCTYACIICTCDVKKHINFHLYRDDAFEVADRMLEFLEC